MQELYSYTPLYSYVLWLYVAIIYIALVEVARVLQQFCSTITLNANMYGTSENVNGDKIAVYSLGMGVAET